MMTEETLAQFKTALENMRREIEMHSLGLMTTDETMLALDRHMFHAHDAWMPTRAGEVDLNTGLRMRATKEQA